jgi:hypothetical protein
MIQKVTNIWYCPSVATLLGSNEQIFGADKQDIGS